MSSYSLTFVNAVGYSTLTPFVPPPTLARRRFPIDEALTIARQIAEALEAAHEQGIIHRDLNSRRTA